MSDDNPPNRTVSIRPRAIDDIERHALFLEQNASLDVARRFRSAIMDAVERIAFMPKAGAPRPLRNPLLSGLRMSVVPDFRNYLMFYLTPEDTIEIIRVFHGAQDIENMLEDEEL